MLARGTFTETPLTTLGTPQSGSKWKLRAVALSIGVAVFLSSAMVDALLYDLRVSPVNIMLASDAVAAFLAAAFALKLLYEARSRRERLQERLELIAETNHHIRNALELIQFSAQSTHNELVIEQITSAVDRIQCVLRELSGEEASGMLRKPKTGKE